MPTNYIFPIDTFYKECVDNKLFDINNDIHTRKMILIAKSIMEKEEVSETVFNIYTSKEWVIKFFKIGKKEKDAEEEKLKKEEAIRQSTPQISELSPEEIDVCNFYNRLKNVESSDKRRKYLEFDILRNRKLLDIANQELKKAEKLFVAYTSQKDWAVLGGIAHAIGGPVAGAMVSMQTIEENNRNY